MQRFVLIVPLTGGCNGGHISTVTIEGKEQTLKNPGYTVSKKQRGTDRKYVWRQCYGKRRQSKNTKHLYYTWTYHTAYILRYHVQESRTVRLPAQCSVCSHSLDPRHLMFRSVAPSANLCPTEHAMDTILPMLVLYVPRMIAFSTYGGAGQCFS